MADNKQTSEQIIRWMNAARETLEILTDGGYSADGTDVRFPEDYRRSVHRMAKDVLDQRPTGSNGTVYEVVPADAFSALDMAEDPAMTAVLSFADGKTPGSGFLDGQQGQETDLCLHSTLYAALTNERANPYYDTNRESPSNIGPVAFLHVPVVYVFRNPDLTLKEIPVRTQVTAMAAPNINGSAKYEDASELRTYYTASIRMMCAYLAGKADTLILGAWGCGSFGNNPWMAAESFRKVLVEDEMGRAFQRVIFAIPDEKSDVFQIFYRTLSTKAVPMNAQENAKPFARGTDAYIVYLTVEGEWKTGRVHVRSAGRKFVTVEGEDGSTRFTASSRAILRAVKYKAYLVHTWEQAELMRAQLYGDGRQQKVSKNTGADRSAADGK